MKPWTSFTKQETARRCPRRFYYQYFSASARAKQLRSLKSVRELGGHCVHSVLAQMIGRIVEGERVSDQFSRIGDALTAFDEVVNRSSRLRPGIIIGEMQLAEVFNDVPCQSEIRDWREMIEIAVTNGVRMMAHFNLRTPTSRYKLIAEQRREYLRRGKMRRFVIDVMIEDESGVTVLDWKVHAISDRDCDQVRHYQEYLLDGGLARPTRIYGFAVDLLHENIVECHYRKIDHVYVPRSNPEAPRSTRPADVEIKSDPDPFSPRPCYESCSICPFATLCPSSALMPREVVHDL